jgi:hypothetical protein
MGKDNGNEKGKGAVRMRVMVLLKEKLRNMVRVLVL